MRIKPGSIVYCKPYKQLVIVQCIIPADSYKCNMRQCSAFSKEANGCSSTFDEEYFAFIDKNGVQCFDIENCTLICE